MFSELASTSPTAPTVCSKPAVGGAKGGGVDVFTDRHFHADETAKISAASASSGKPNFFIKPTLLRGSAFGRRLYFSAWRITSAQSVLFGRKDDWLVLFGESFELHVQRLHAQAEQPPGFGLIPSGLPQCGFDQRPLVIVNHNWQINAAGRDHSQRRITDPIGQQMFVNARWRRVD